MNFKIKTANFFFFKWCRFFHEQLKGSSSTLSIFIYSRPRHNRKKLQELHLFVYPKWSFNLSNCAWEFIFQLADNLFQTFTKKKASISRIYVAFAFDLPSWLDSFTTWRDSQEKKFELIFGYFCFQWKHFQTMSFWKKFENFFISTNFKLCLLLFNAQRQEIFLPIFIHSFCLASYTQYRKSDAFFGFPVCKWKRVLIVAFVLKMKSLLEFRIKGFSTWWAGGEAIVFLKHVLKVSLWSIWWSATLFVSDIVWKFLKWFYGAFWSNMTVFFIGRKLNLK